MKIKHLRNIKIYLVTFCITFLCASVSALEIDWDGSIGKGEHKYVPAISNPLFNETPYITTEVRPIYLHQSMPSQNVLGGGLFGGSIDVVAVELRLALTDNLGIIATKDGYAWVDFDSTTNGIGIEDDEGFANISLGLKYAFWNNIEDKSIVTFGVEYEPPTGGLSIDTPLAHPLDNVDLQQSGDGFIDVFVTGAKRFDKLGIQGSIGGNFAIDTDHDSSLLHYSLHADYEVTKNVFPMIELNGFTVIDDGARTPLGFEGVDLVNLGCSTGCGTVLTAAGGMRFRATDNLLLGVGIEKSIAREDLLDWRSYVDVVLHF